MAYSIDRAVWTFGTTLDYEMDQAGDAITNTDPKTNAMTQRVIAARQAVWESFMEDDHPSAPLPPPGRFADPMAQISQGNTGR